jgi:DNA-directed RNA polymerase specialized sigma subunit
VVKIESILNNYELYRNELEADLCLLQNMLGLDAKEPGETIAELGQMLRFIKGCTDFMYDVRVEQRLEHAELRFKQISMLDWLIRSRTMEEQKIINALYVEGLSLAKAAERFYISKSTMFRRKQNLLSSLEIDIQHHEVFEELWNGTE